MPFNIVLARLHHQLLSQTPYRQPEEVVEWLGAMQAQDYAGAKWALSQRLKNAPTDAFIEGAFNEGRILRTHVMRPTWHFVTPADILWMLELTAPRVLAAMAYMDRQLGLDKAIIKKSNSVLRKTLRGNRQFTRSELAPILEKAGVPVDGYRLGQLMGHAELHGVICSGGRKGKQFTYALLEERAPQAKSLAREDAVTELTRRYYRSHGPATLEDFVWWSGLTMTDARQGIESVQPEFEREIAGDRVYWFSRPASSQDLSAKAYLLPSYDEYTVAYTDRSAIYDGAHADKLGSRESILMQVILINGQVAGTWKRTLKKREVIVEVAPFNVLKRAQNQAVIEAAQGYSRFLELPLVLV